MRRKLLFVLSALWLAATVRCQDDDRAGGVFQPGEFLRYRVKWAFFRLGTLTIRTERDSATPDGSDYRVIMKVESNPALQFLWIQETNESHMDSADISTCRFEALHRNGDDLVEVRQRYDRATQTAYASKVDRNTGLVLFSRTIANAPRFVDGSALLFKARALSRSRGAVRLPTMIDGKIENTVIEYGGGIEALEIDTWKDEIRTRKYSGRAEWTGGTSAGLGGEFNGWVSDDDAAVPIRAEMKILIGSIVLELEEWSRQNWAPPAVATMAERSDR